MSDDFAGKTVIGVQSDAADDAAVTITVESADCAAAAQSTPSERSATLPRNLEDLSPLDFEALWQRVMCSDSEHYYKEIDVERAVPSEDRAGDADDDVAEREVQLTVEVQVQPGMAPVELALSGDKLIKVNVHYYDVMPVPISNSRLHHKRRRRRRMRNSKLLFIGTVVLLLLLLPVIVAVVVLVTDRATTPES